MSTSYYSFIRDSSACVDKAQEVVGSVESRRETTMSPSSLVISSSRNCDSSLDHFNSMIQTHTNSMCPTKIPLSTSSISPSSSSTSSSASSSLANSSITTSNLSMRLANSTISPGANDGCNDIISSVNSIDSHHYHRDLMRQSSITPNRMHHHPSQLHHSYTLHSLEPKPLKPFKSQSAYLEAMKEDLAEWLNRLYSDLDLTTDNFFSQLETGAIICRHANNVTQMGRDAMLEQTTNDSSNGSSLNELDSSNNQLSSPSPDYNDDDSFRRRNDNYAQHRQHSTTQLSSITFSRFSSSSNNNCSKQRPSLTGSLSSNGSLRADRTINWFRVKMIPYKKDAKPGTFFARDNICQFILWCRSLDILECLLFETDDLVARKNEKSFILCLLEVARIGFKVGMPTPLIIQLEQEIDREIENDAKYQRQLEEEQERMKTGVIKNDENILEQLCTGHEDGNNNVNHSNVTEAAKKDLLDQESSNNFKSVLELKNSEDKDAMITTLDEKAEEEEVYYEDVGPKPQVITNDLLSLHEKVVQLLCQCTCATQFPMVRIGDGKYKVGDKLIIFVRILRRHIMVRVGGGWQELSEFLNQKDPCRAKHHLVTSNQQHGLQQPNGILTTTTKLMIATNDSANNSSGIARLRSIGSSSTYLNRSYYHNQQHNVQQNQQSQNQRQSYKYSGVPRLISGSASMSWLSNN